MATYDVPMNKTDLIIKFQVSCRTVRQKKSVILGFAAFDINSLRLEPDLACTQALPIADDLFECGTLNVTLELGRGRLHFGRKFIGKKLEAFGNYDYNWNVLELLDHRRIRQLDLEDFSRELEENEQRQSVKCEDKRSALRDSERNEPPTGKTDKCLNETKDVIKESADVANEKTFVKDLPVPTNHLFDVIIFLLFCFQLCFLSMQV